MRVSVTKITLDIKNDYECGFLTFPTNTHVPSVGLEIHAFLALQFDTDPLQLQDITSAALPTHHTFHETIKDLWIEDPQLRLNSRDLLKQSVAALASVEALLIPGLPEPKGYAEAVAPDHPEREEWMAAIDKELKMLASRGTWSTVLLATLRARNGGLLPKDKKRPVHCKFVFKKKFNKDGSLQYKARLVACGYLQTAGTDYSSDELYASVCSYSSMRFLMSMSTQKGYLLYQTDIQGAYLEPDLKDEIYMDPPGPLKAANADSTFRIHKGLYGLKQSGWAWAQCFQDFLLRDPDYEMGFTVMTGEQNLYRKTFLINGELQEIFVGQYVDDCFIAASSQPALDWFLDRMKKRYPVNPNSSGEVTVASPGRLLSMNVYYDRENGIL
jgi:hypothetical protein